MTNKLNITKGEARVQNNTDGDPFSIAVNDKLVAKAFEGMHPYATVKSNATLIADAFNTYNKTGLLPSELAEQLEIGANQYAKVVTKEVEGGEQ